MDRIITYLIILVVVALVIFLARRSRKRFEEEFGSPTTNEKWESLGLFVLWICLFTLCMFVYPTAFGWTYLILLVLGAPFALSKPSRKRSWRIQESGLLAFIIFGPFALIYYYG
jgi:hypothetical protein